MQEWLIGLGAGLFSGIIGFFLGSIVSPHAKAFKTNAQVWQGQYSALKKEFTKIEREADMQDPLNQLGAQLGISPDLIKLAKPWIEKNAPALIQKFMGQNADSGFAQEWK